MGIDAEMFVRTMATITDEQLRQWNYQLGSIFGHDAFWIWEASEPEDCRRSIARIPVYEQDGPDITPEEGETFLQLSPSTRWYGAGYERGDLPFLVALAEWCESVIPGADVWYGGDSSGVIAEPFGIQARHHLLKHLYSEAGRDYFLATDRSSLFPAGEWKTPHCEFCGVDMTRTGFGGVGDSYGGYVCYGCGKEVETRDTGKSWQDRKMVGGRGCKATA